ncbi:isoleucine--tRNA ligase [Holospora obtusa F1]|uniref:Isoleucine--tRNA ligase n=1 Tax=Holospora obtusa F1 TaxID=1399147 RepID=W6TDH0_HOLOB|nr:isoleucine--tRNA ligase [Holospora obtusa]ETZ07078.1 isoleucine--tRNA ligase [Holospora obtusa F1]
MFFMVRASYPVLLPNTQFPMKGDLSLKEPLILSWWKNIKLYDCIRALRKGRSLKVLADGPPYANGPIHLGHALNKILKDIVNRFNVIYGFDIDFVPGWDCHGLPIEAQIEKEYLKKGVKKREVSSHVLRTHCRDFAERWIEEQSVAMQRLGVLGKFDDLYSTMKSDFEACVVQALFELFQKDLIYQGTRPVLWSCVEQTALAEAEVEYKDITSLALYVKFPVCSSISDCGLNESRTSVLIWTTTPWSLPGNRAICYNFEFVYVLVEIEDEDSNLWKKGERIIIAQDRISCLESALGLKKYRIASVLTQDVLKKIFCHHPLNTLGYTFKVPLLPALHVTCDVGTGFVHTAPNHGPEDFLVGVKYHLEIPETILSDGTFSECAPGFTGKNMWKTDIAIKDALLQANTLGGYHEYLHSYPHSWRSKTPLCYRTTPQWFIRLDQEGKEGSLREKALHAIQEGKVSWHPKSSSLRLANMLRNRPDWCISRQRAWGIPLMFFVNKRNGACLNDSSIFQKLYERVQKEGVDFWFTDEPFLMFPELSPQDWYKVEDIMDVWLESGLTHRSVLKNRTTENFSLWPAWAYFEGSDQHRGWFQSSLLTGVALENRPPFQSVLTHGFLLDESGEKQSKSKGNGIDPVKFTNEHGADLLRLWVAHEDYEKDIRVGDEVFARVKDMYKKYRNTLRFMLGVLNGISVKDLLPIHQLDFLSRRVLYNLYHTHTELLTTLSLDQVTNSEFQGRCLNVQSFLKRVIQVCTDLSIFYLDVKKDTLYCDASDAFSRKQVLTTLLYCFIFLCKHLAPILPFTTEEAFSIFGKEVLGLGDLIDTPEWKKDLSLDAVELLSWFKKEGVLQEREYWSVHLQDIFSPSSCFKDWDGSTCSEHILGIRSQVTEILEIYRKNKEIKSSLDAKVYIDLMNEDGVIAGAYKDFYETILIELCMTSDLKIRWNQACRTVKVEVLNWNKCPRCWKRYSDIQESQICQRCHSVLMSENVC